MKVSLKLVRLVSSSFGIRLPIIPILKFVDRFWLNLAWSFEMTCFTRKKRFIHFLSANIAVFGKIRKPKYWKISNVNISNTNGPILIKLGLNLWGIQLIKYLIYFLVFNSNHCFILYWTSYITIFKCVWYPTNLFVHYGSLYLISYEEIIGQTLKIKTLKHS